MYKVDLDFLRRHFSVRGLGFGSLGNCFLYASTGVQSSREHA